MFCKYLQLQDRIDQSPEDSGKQAWGQLIRLDGTTPLETPQRLGWSEASADFEKVVDSGRKAVDEKYDHLVRPLVRP